jgi:hypothetical protein
MADSPLPRSQLKYPLLPWDLIWKRLAAPFLPPQATDHHFRALHNLLTTLERRHRIGDTPLFYLSSMSWTSGGQPKSLHLLLQGGRSLGYLLHRAIMMSGLALTSHTLLYLAWSLRPARLEAAITLAVVVFTAWAWETRVLSSVFMPPDINAKVDLAVTGSPHPSIF